MRPSPARKLRWLPVTAALLLGAALIQLPALSPYRFVPYLAAALALAWVFRARWVFSGIFLVALADLGFEKGLIVGSDMDENVYLASRNVPGVYAMDAAGIDPVSLVGADKVIVTVGAVKKIQEWLG